MAADELRDSPFLGERTIRFVESIIRSSSYAGQPSSVITPVTGFEKKLLENQDKVQAINDELKGELVSLIRESQKYIPPHTSMRVLLYAYAKGFLSIAEEMIYYTTVYQVALSDNEVNKIVNDMKKEPNIPIQLLMSLYGEPPEEKAIEIKKPFTLPSDFN